MGSRLSKLYDTPETGNFNYEELALRIKALHHKKEELLQAKAEAEETLHCKAMDQANPQMVQDYTNDLRELLGHFSITEQRGFLKSFIEKIETDDSELKVY